MSFYARKLFKLEPFIVGISFFTKQKPKQPDKDESIPPEPDDCMSCIRENAFKKTKLAKDTKTIIITEMKNARLVGCITGISVNGNTVFKEAIGLGNVEKVEKARTDTRCNIADITKLYTAYLVVKMFQGGTFKRLHNLTIESAVSSERDYHFYSLAHLMTHTADLRQYGNQENFNVRRFCSSFDVWKSLITEYGPSNLDLVFYDQELDLEKGIEPNTKTRYSSIGYEVLGFLLEKFASEFCEIVPYYNILTDELIRINHNNSLLPQVQNVNFNHCRGHSCSDVYETQINKDDHLKWRLEEQYINWLDENNFKHPKEFESVPYFANGIREQQNNKLSNSKYIDLSSRYPSRGMISDVDDVIKFGDLFLRMDQDLSGGQPLSSGLAKLMWSFGVRGEGEKEEGIEEKEIEEERGDDDDDDEYVYDSIYDSNKDDDDDDDDDCDDKDGDDDGDLEDADDNDDNDDRDNDNNNASCEDDVVYDCEDYDGKSNDDCESDDATNNSDCEDDDNFDDGGGDDGHCGGDNDDADDYDDYDDDDVSGYWDDLACFGCHDDPRPQLKLNLRNDLPQGNGGIGDRLQYIMYHSLAGVPPPQGGCCDVGGDENCNKFQVATCLGWRMATYLHKKDQLNRIKLLRMAACHSGMGMGATSRILVTSFKQEDYLKIKDFSFACEAWSQVRYRGDRRLVAIPPPLPPKRKPPRPISHETSRPARSGRAACHVKNRKKPPPPVDEDIPLVLDVVPSKKKCSLGGQGSTMVKRSVDVDSDKCDKKGKWVKLDKNGCPVKKKNRYNTLPQDDIDSDEDDLGSEEFVPEKIPHGITVVFMTTVDKYPDVSRVTAQLTNLYLNKIDNTKLE